MSLRYMYIGCSYVVIAYMFMLFTFSLFICLYCLHVYRLFTSVFVHMFYIILNIQYQSKVWTHWYCMSIGFHYLFINVLSLCQDSCGLIKRYLIRRFVLIETFCPSPTMWCVHMCQRQRDIVCSPKCLFLLKSISGWPFIFPSSISWQSLSVWEDKRADIDVQQPCCVLYVFEHVCMRSVYKFLFVFACLLLRVVCTTVYASVYTFSHLHLHLVI